MDNEIQVLTKEVNKRKRIANERASLVHDLVEDRLFVDYHALVDLAQKTVAACEEWAAAKKKLVAVES